MPSTDRKHSLVLGVLGGIASGKSAAAELLAYCMIGAEAFGGANDSDLASAIERRIDAALASPASLDAQLVLLTLHAKIIQPSVVHQFQIESSTD